MDIGSLTGKLTLEDQMSAVLKKADEALTKFSESATGSAQKMTNLGTSMASVGKSITALSVPIMAVGGAALAAGYSIEGAYNTIARKTGETGEALEGLKKDFEAVFVTVPNSAQEVATAIADVHQRLGLTGTELQSVTKKFIDFANVNAIDVATATKTVSTLMSALSADTKLTKEEIGGASGIMDKLTYASQISGASVGKLAEGVVKGGVAFKEMGFGLNESIALFAQFEKVGANTTDVTSSLGKVMSDLAKSGVTDLSGAFKAIIKDIRDTDTFSQAVTKSVQTFGAIAGRKLAEEIKGGTYIIDELAGTLDRLGNVTDETAKASQSFNETLGTLKNAATLALAPLGIQMIESMKKLIPVIADVISVVAKMVDLFTKLPEGVQTFLLAVGGIIAVIGPVIIALGTMYEKFLLLGGAKGIAYVGGLLADFGITAGVVGAAMTTLLIGAAVIAGFVALGVALWEVGKAIKSAYEWWQQGKPMWEFFTQRDEDNFVRRGLKWVGILDSTKEGITSITPGIGFLESEIANIGETTGSTAETFDLLQARLNKMRTDAMQPLDAQTKASIKELHGLSATVEEISKAMPNVAAPAIKRYVESLEEAEKASKKLAEEQKKLTEWIKETNQEWSRLGPDAFKATAKVTAAADAMAKSIISNDAMMRDAQNELNDLVYEGMVERVTFELHQLDVLNYNTKLKLDENIENYAAAAAAIDALTERKKENVRKQDEIESADDAFKGLMPDIVPQWKKHIGAIGEAFGDMFEGVNNKVGQIFKVMGSGMDFLVTKAENVGQKMAAGFAMAASVLSTVLGPEGGGKWGGAAEGALSGAGAGAGIGFMFGGPAGAAIGAGVGAAVGAVTGWISATKKAAEAEREATAEVEKLKFALVEQYGSLENLEDISQRLFGMSFVGEWGNQGAEGLKKMTEFTKDFEERLAAVTDAVNKMVTGFAATTSVLTEGLSSYGEAVTKAQENYDKLAESGKATDEQLALASAAVTQALEAQYQAGQNNVQMLTDLGIQGIATFSAVYMATGSYTEALAAVAPSLATLNQAYIDLGLQVDDVLLSHLMLQAGVLEANPALMAAIDGQAAAMQGMAQMGLLNAETFGAMQRTGIELYQRLQAETAAQAAATGDLGDHTVDALMPMQGYLHEATIQAELLGLPLDANTQMLIDQSKELGIWKEAGATAQDKLIKGMDQLVAKLDVMLGNLGAMTGLLTNMPDAHSTVTVDHIDRYQKVYLPDQRSEGATDYKAGGGVVYAGGGFVPHGTDTVPAMLTPGERVLTTSENRAYERDKGGNKQDTQLAGSIDRLTEAMLGQNEALMIGMRDMILERG